MSDRAMLLIALGALKAVELEHPGVAKVARMIEEHVEPKAEAPGPSTYALEPIVYPEIKR